MNSIKITALMLLAGITATPAVAEVYKCIDDKGKARFSDQPCGDNAETIDIKVQSSGVGGSTSGDWSKVVDSNRERDRTRAVDGHETTISRLRNERDDKLDELRSRQGRTNNNLAGATYRQAIASEMQAVSEDYNARISSERETIRDIKTQ